MTDTLDSLPDTDALGLAGLVARGEVSTAELVETVLARIEAVEPTLNAVVATLADRARQQAAATRPGDGPFAGVPYPIKDLGAALAGVPTSNGTALLRDLPAPVTTTAVARLEAAGLIPVAKTTTPEFGLSFATESRALGPTRNPWNTAHTPGGSSGGSAALVAAGVVPAAHGSDGGGSIRVPAACCGLFGLKPSRGRVPAGPVLGEGWGGLAGEHAITRSVRDSAALLDAVAGLAPGDPYTAPTPQRPFLAEVHRAPGRLRIALDLHERPGAPLDPACRAATEDAARLCESLGHDVIEVGPQYDATAFGGAFMALVTAHVATDLGRIAHFLARPIPDAALEALTARLRGDGQNLAATALVQARDVLHGIGRGLGTFFETYDLWLTPALARSPVPIGWIDTDSADTDTTLARQLAFSPYTQIANAAGIPAMSLPLGGETDAGLPLGVQVLAPYGREDVLFRLAGQLERARPWWDRRPPISR